GSVRRARPVRPPRARGRGRLRRHAPGAAPRDAGLSHHPDLTMAASTDIKVNVAKRRTFAIISHPDAGKTTLTEKLLLYGGAVHLAGSVKGKKGSRAVTSDWMEIERQRGISVTSSVLQFEYAGRR